jgi:hypothetical protein
MPGLAKEASQTRDYCVAKNAHSARFAWLCRLRKWEEAEDFLGRAGDCGKDEDANRQPLRS